MNPLPPIKSLLGAALLLSALALKSEASVIFSEGFEYDTSLSTSLTGRSGGTGFTGAWNTNVTSGSLYLQNGGLSYQVVGGGFIDGGNTALRFDGASTTSQNNLFNRSFTSFNGDEMYVSYLIQVPIGKTLASTKSTGIWFNNDNNWIYNYNATGTGSFGARIGGSSTNDPVGPLMAPGTTYFVVAKLSKSNPGEENPFNRIDLWLNPGAGDLSSTPLFTATATGPTGAVSAYDLLGYRTNLASGNAIVIDNLVAGTTWSDVVPVPEPGSFALLGLTGLAAFLLKRKKG